MEKIKIQDIKNPKIIKEVSKSLAGDYIGTGKFKLYDEKKEEKKPSFNLNKSNTNTEN